MSRAIRLSPRAKAQLDSLFLYIARNASSAVATRFVDAVLVKVEGLADFPNRGTPRDDLRPGMRTIPFRRRLTIAYAVFPEEVLITGIFYAGQDFETLLQDPEES